MEARKEEVKSSNDKVREKFQLVLDAIEQHIKSHPDKYKSTLSDRFKYAENVIDNIYHYYKKPVLIETFKEKLAQYIEQLDTEDAKIKEELKTFQIVPKLSELFTPPNMPQALYEFHDIMVKLMQDANAIYDTTWFGSDLHKWITQAASGHQEIAKELGQHACLAIFSSKLDAKKAAENAIVYANYLYECLIDRTVFHADLKDAKTKAFSRSNLTFHAIFDTSKADIMYYLSTNGYNEGCCISVKFNFQWLKTKELDEFVPDLNSAKCMSIWNVSNGSEQSCYIKADAAEKAFVITPLPSPTIKL